MLALFSTLVFATAGCASAAVIGTSLRSALPHLRALAADRHSLAEDRVYLVSLIETPRHAGAPAPQVIPAVIRAGAPIRRRAARPVPAPGSSVAAGLRAAA